MLEVPCLRAARRQRTLFASTDLRNRNCDVLQYGRELRFSDPWLSRDMVDLFHALLLFFAIAASIPILPGEPLKPSKNATSQSDYQAFADNILKLHGLRQKVEVIIDPNAKGCAYATTILGAQRIGIDPDCVGPIRKNNGLPNPKAAAIVAHEVGHLATGGTVKRVSHQDELDADYFSGFTMKKLGFSLEESTLFAKGLAPEGSTSHPARQARLDAFTRGWIDAQQQAKSAPLPMPSNGEPFDPGPYMPYAAAATGAAALAIFGRQLLKNARNKIVPINGHNQEAAPSTEPPEHQSQELPPIPNPLKELVQEGRQIGFEGGRASGARRYDPRVVELMEAGLTAKTIAIHQGPFDPQQNPRDSMIEANLVRSADKLMDCDIALDAAHKRCMDARQTVPATEPLPKLNMMGPALSVLVLGAAFGKTFADVGLVSFESDVHQQALSYLFGAALAGAIVANIVGTVPNNPKNVARFLTTSAGSAVATLVSSILCVIACAALRASICSEPSDYLLLAGLTAFEIGVIGSVKAEASRYRAALSTWLKAMDNAAQLEQTALLASDEEDRLKRMRPALAYEYALALRAKEVRLAHRFDLEAANLAVAGAVRGGYQDAISQNIGRQ